MDECRASLPLSQGSFPLEFSMQSLPPEACVELIYDGVYEISEGSWGSDHLRADVKSEAGLHALTARVHRRGKGSMLPLCSQVWSYLQLLERSVIYEIVKARQRMTRMVRVQEPTDGEREEPLIEIHVAFEVFEESIKKVHVEESFPPMALTCRNAYSKHIHHLCRTAELPASGRAHAFTRPSHVFTLPR